MTFPILITVYIKTIVSTHCIGLQASTCALTHTHTHTHTHTQTHMVLTHSIIYGPSPNLKLPFNAVLHGSGMLQATSHVSRQFRTFITFTHIKKNTHTHTLVQNLR